MLWTVLSLTPILAYGQPLAFPHAEGFGRFATGGRGGDVYHVTNLLDYEPGKDSPVAGSFRYGLLSQSGPRTIVFDVSGTIRLVAKFRSLNNSQLTIAGQTAPGDGITIRDHNFKLQGDEASPLHDIIIRFIRFRYGDATRGSGDALSTNWVNDLILDHISAGWSVDAIHDFRDGARFTMQWSILSEALNNSSHYEKKSHAMLSSYSHIRGNVSLHHNLMASGRNRHPTLGAGSRSDTNAIVDFRNNVVYNWASGTNFGGTRQNFVNNYYKPGPSTSYANNKPLRFKSTRAASSKGYLHGNFFVGAPPSFNEDNYTAVDYRAYGSNYTGTSREQFQWDTPFVLGDDVPATQSAQEIYPAILVNVGASYARDAVDSRVISGVKDGTNRVIDSQDQVGGWPDLKSKPAPLDSDRDGMPDSWEKKHKLNPRNPADRNGYALDKEYTNLEVYLNGLVEHLYSM